MVALLIPSATTSNRTTFPTHCCNCANADQFLNFFRSQISTETLYDFINNQVAVKGHRHVEKKCRLFPISPTLPLLSDIGRHPLRSNSKNSNDIRKLLLPRTHNKLGDRSFSAAGPRLWNDLPPGLRRPGLTFDSFRQSLKTHLFGDRSA